MSRDIHHSFVMNAPIEEIVGALMDASRVREWWTREAQSTSDTLLVRWDGYGWLVEFATNFDETSNTVEWRCVTSNMQNTDAWVGTTVTFRMVPLLEGTRVEFAQTGYRDSPCFDVCVQGWEFFLGTSLRLYLESGKGIPYPEMLDTSQS